MLRLKHRAVPLPRSSRGRVSFSAGTAVGNYNSTVKNLAIGKHTRVIFQGFTGRQATANAKESLAWGTNVVGGVTPGRDGEHLGLPLLPSVRKAAEVLRPDATGIYVAAHQAAAAIEEAIEAEIPLVVAVAEHIPLHDMIRIHSILQTQSKSRLVGPNSPGIISAVGSCRIGFQPLPCFTPGRAGIVAKSGTLSYETAASLLRSGLGQSLCIGVGGDVLPGTSLLEGLQVLAEDEATEAIAICGEIGGHAEIEAAEWIKEYRSRTKSPKPIAAIVAGACAVPGRIMGHAGAFLLPGEPTVAAKVEALKQANVAVVHHPSRFGPVLKTLLDGSAPAGTGGVSTGAASQKRSMHCFARRPRFPMRATTTPRVQQTRTIYLTQAVTFDLLRSRGIPTSRELLAAGPQRQLAVSINRSSRSPCIAVSGDATAPGLFDFDYHQGAGELPVREISAALRLDRPRSVESLQVLLQKLVALFAEKEAFLLATKIVQTEDDDGLAVAGAQFGFDDAAFRSSGRQADIHAPRRDAAPQSADDDAQEAAAARDGIVYIKLGGAGGNIGTLVNGAGLAMNTVDALADAGGRAANFLDTGGKATRETVKRSFEIILADPRVKCILVNIFGGLTLGDMIAEGIVLAFRELRMEKPVVVRIRGTNEAAGQRIIADSGLPLFAFDDFDEAAAKAVELANKES